MFLQERDDIAYGILKRGYSWSEMDWDEDGHTSVSEPLKSLDIGKRELFIKEGLYCN